MKEKQEHRYSQWHLYQDRPNWADHILGTLQLIGVGVIVGFGMSLGITILNGLALIFNK